ncbi:cytochrome c oxidase subunit 3 family protein [Mycobacterium sp. CVI_P3]|uniref:Probable cytochrome c oxidase subunit 3 n=1 Tax=Mycobacterium pinniadriaticum TaxID=2994102 RepID=A0ABT3SI26_9MYCO|nr:cytochrome c oxidase subunit 3 family protein [Mycobacterium pinniadriaticum]MCX2932374.1 cytochrome c oxidase subunit 3 family protein [Mycobacterium pinniadriaticum]MCX2938769.1 cytochrome c oxidase subunit 3 family protein [Mycobacterium pinniadriaticum]
MTQLAALSDRTRRLTGLDGIWVLIGADSVVFAILFASFMAERRHDPGIFEASRQTLNADLGGVDTLILLTSSWLVAMAIQALKQDQTERVSRFLLAGALTGVLFVASKAVEYAGTIAHGITPATNSFYMWYFTLTGIHLLHVVMGIALLSFVWLRSRRGLYGRDNAELPESVAVFWHLVDYVWIVLFPLLYLMKAAT